MIDIYRKGETVDLVLPGDDKNPTVFQCEVMTDEEEARFQLYRAYAVSQVESKGPNDLQAAAEKVRVNVRQNRSLLASKVKCIINAPPDGQTITDPEAIEGIIECLAPEQMGTLRASLSDMNELRKLKFRGDSPAGNATGAGENREAAPQES